MHHALAVLRTKRTKRNNRYRETMPDNASNKKCALNTFYQNINKIIVFIYQK